MCIEFCTRVAMYTGNKSMSLQMFKLDHHHYHQQQQQEEEEQQQQQQQQHLLLKIYNNELQSTSDTK